MRPFLLLNGRARPYRQYMGTENFLMLINQCTFYILYVDPTQTSYTPPPPLPISSLSPQFPFQSLPLSTFPLSPSPPSPLSPSTPSLSPPLHLPPPSLFYFILLTPSQTFSPPPLLPTTAHLHLQSAFSAQHLLGYLLGTF